MEQEPIKTINEKDNWVHRSKGMVCGTCMYFIEKKTIKDSKDYKCIGRCRKKAPTMKGWPVLFSTDWCGDHKLDENKI